MKKVFQFMGWRQWLLLGLLAAAVLLGAVYWQVFNPVEKQNLAGERLIKNFEEAMRADTYGGATPEETLKMLVAALRQEDVNLASQLFMLDAYGRRDQWIEYLKDSKSKGLMRWMADSIETKAQPAGSSYEGDFKFELFNEEGLVAVLINMEWNRFAQVWKIQSM